MICGVVFLLIAILITILEKNSHICAHWRLEILCLAGQEHLFGNVSGGRNPSWMFMLLCSCPDPAFMFLSSSSFFCSYSDPVFLFLSSSSFFVHAFMFLSSSCFFVHIQIQLFCSCFYVHVQIQLLCSCLAPAFLFLSSSSFFVHAFMFMLLCSCPDPAFMFLSSSSFFVLVQLQLFCS
jgi:hypothetical protein